MCVLQATSDDQELYFAGTGVDETLGRASQGHKRARKRMPSDELRAFIWTAFRVARLLLVHLNG